MLAVCLVLLPLVAFTACGGGTRGMAEGKMEAERAPEPAAAPTGPPRVFFVAPEDGAVLSIDHDVEIEFGIENFAISARPEREMDTSRDRVGHYHLGYNTGCLDAGVIIPRGQGVAALRRRLERDDAGERAGRHVRANGADRRR